MTRSMKRYGTQAYYRLGRFQVSLARSPLRAGVELDWRGKRADVRFSVLGD